MVSITYVTNEIVAFIQEYQSEKSLEALKKLAPYQCHVIRNGIVVDELASQLVPGDLIRIYYGDRIPADARLIVCSDLYVDESSLTGETEPVRKNNLDILETGKDLQISERINIVFMGSLVKNGYGTAVVIGTGNQTELGTICSMVKDIEKPRTPLQNNMDELGKQLSICSFTVILVIGLIGIIQGRPWLDVFTISVSLAVAAIPEGLPIVVTVTLALGVIRMAKKKAIAKKLPAVESLGAVNVICMDKTGTITINKMTVSLLYTVADNCQSNPTALHNPTQSVSLLMRIGNLCNNATIDDLGNVHGSPTEVAIIETINAYQFPDERTSTTRISEILFTPETKFMGVEVKHSDGVIIHYFKGALESILPKCKHAFKTMNESIIMTEILKKQIMLHEELMSNQGLRVLAFAYSKNNGSDFVFVGFMGMYDPPRLGIGSTIQKLKMAGIRFTMITGDSRINFSNNYSWNCQSYCRPSWHTGS